MTFPVMCCVNKKTNKLTWQKAIQISKTVTVPCSDDIPKHHKKTNKLTWQKAIQISKTVTVPCSDDIPKHHKKTNKLTWQKAIQISKTVTVPCSDDIPCDVLCKQENEQVDMAESDTDQQDSNSAVQ
ncbi:hypothetical protein ACOMHN_056602 [Nucella lapillus]